MRSHKRKCYSDASRVAVIGAAGVAALTLAACASTNAASGAASQAGTDRTLEDSAKLASPGDPQPATDSVWLEAEEPTLRELTVAIRVAPPLVLAERYKALAAQHRELSPLLLTHAEGGFGSGFLMVRRKDDREGAPQGAYFVTNQHVVAMAEKAKIQLNGVEGPFAARVVYVDDAYDLAILVLHEGDVPLPTLPSRVGFGLEKEAAEDQDAVVAAGYPGIAGEPSYQVTRGYVSNERLLLAQSGKRLPHIQHTAPIDPGSSGGPLLSENQRVLGVNTLKIRNREGVGVAIPVAAISEALENAHRLASAQPQKETEDASRLACEALLQNLLAADRPQEVERSLSANLVAKDGPESLGLLPDDGTNWGFRFVESPDDVLLHALYLRLRETLRLNAADAAPRLACEPVAPAASTTQPDGRVHTFVVRLGDQSRTLRFAPEQNRFKLVEANLAPPSRGSFLLPKKAKVKKWSPSLK